MGSYLINPATGLLFTTARAPTGTTLAPNTLGRVPTSLGAATVLLPAAPGDTNAIAIVDVDGAAAANPITVDGNGKLIDGAADVVLNTAGVQAVFVFDTTVGEWTRVLPQRIWDAAYKAPVFRAGDLPPPDVSIEPFSFVRAVEGNVTSFDAAGDFTVASMWYVNRSGYSCTGVRFLWLSADRTLRVSLWDNNSTLLATEVQLRAGTGVFEINFAAPIALTANHRYRTGVYQTDATKRYTGALTTNVDLYLPKRPFLLSTDVVLRSANLWANGNVAPGNTDDANTYIIEPILAR